MMRSLNRPPIITARTSGSNEPRTKGTFIEITDITASGLRGIGKRKFNKFYVVVNLVVDKTVLSSRITSKVKGHCPHWEEIVQFARNDAEQSVVFEVYGKRSWPFRDVLVGHVSHLVSITNNEGSERFEKRIKLTTKKTSNQLARLKFTVTIRPDGDLLNPAGVAIMNLATSGRMHTAVEGVGAVVDKIGSASGQMKGVESLLSPLIEKMKVFSYLVSTISKIHPYAQAAYEIICAVYKIYDNQRKLDSSIIQLFNTMNALYERINNFRKRIESPDIPDVSDNVLLRVAQEASDCSYFIQDYCSSSFVGRLGRNMAKNTVSKIDEYKKKFQDMKEEFGNDISEGTYANTVFVLKEIKNQSVELAIGKLPLADRASLVVSHDDEKHCLAGTRTGILSEITDWINCVVAGSSSQRALLLTGAAGSGKSTIAHTIASRFSDIGRLGASFGFVRGDKDRRVTQLFPHIARLLTRLGSDAMKTALAEVIIHDEELVTSTDLRKQFRHFLVEPLKDMTIVGSIVIVIDAIDEAIDGTQSGLQHLDSLVSIIKNDLQSLPSNIRFLITTRNEPRIVDALQSMHIRIQDIDSIPTQLANEDLELYVQKRLGNYSRLRGIDVKSIAHRSERLFQWAFVVCNEIANAEDQGSTPQEVYKAIMESGRMFDTNHGPLDTLYREVLTRHFVSSVARKRFRKVMSMALALQEPLPEDALHMLWHALGRDTEDVMVVFKGSQSLLSGVGHPAKVIQLSHTSFRDFLTDKTRSGDSFFLDILAAHQDLALASLHVMRDKLSFNMCKLESSHVLNKEIPHLEMRVSTSICQECLYACQFWAEHLKQVDSESLAEFYGDASFQQGLKDFLTKQLLYWLEVLSVLGKASTAWPSIWTLRSHLARNDISARIRKTISPTLTKDIEEFIRICAPIASLSAPHIYLSALSFTSSTSSVYRLYNRRFPSRLKVVDADSALLAPTITNTISYGSYSIGPIALSPDCTLIAAACGAYVVLLNVHTGEPVGDLYQHLHGEIYALKFSLDGSNIASCSTDGTIELWSVYTQKAIKESLRWDTGRLFASPKTLEPVRDPIIDPVAWPYRRSSVAWSSDGNCIVSGSTRGVQAWAVFTGEQIWCHRQREVLSVACSPDGTLVASSVEGQKHVIVLWRAEDGERIDKLSGPTEGVTSVVFSPDGSRIAAGSYDCKIWLWDVKTRMQIGKPLEGHRDKVLCIAFSPDGSRIASVSEDETIRLWILGNGESISGRIIARACSSSDVAFLADGTHIVTAGHGAITVWNTESQNDTESYGNVGHKGIVTCLAFLPSGQLVSGSSDGTVQMWNLDAKKPLVKSFNQSYLRSIMAVAVSPDGAFIASSSSEIVILWETNTGRSWCIGRPSGSSSLHLKEGIKALCFSDNGSNILWCSNTELRIWGIDFQHNPHDRDDCSVKLLTNSIFGSEDPKNVHLEYMKDVYPHAFSPDRRLVALASSRWSEQKCKIFLWDVIQCEWFCSPWVTGTGTTCLDFSPDGRRIVSSHGDGSACLWDTSGNLLQTYEVRYFVQVVKFSPTGRHIASCIGGDDSAIRIWDAGSGKTVGNPIRSGGRIESLAFSRDSERIVSGTLHGDIAVWDVSKKSLTSSSGPVLFSYNDAHAMPSTSILFQKGPSSGYDLRDSIRLDKSGFVVATVDNEDRILFWIPPHLRSAIYIPRRNMVRKMGTWMELDLTRFVHGMDWTKCYHRRIEGTDHRPRRTNIIS